MHRTRTGLLAAALLLAACESPSDSGRPGEATRMVIALGDFQTDTVGQQLPQPVAVRLLDARRRPVAGVAVEFRVAAGEGSMGANSATTDRDGVAQAWWTLGTVAGDTQRVEARVDGQQLSAAFSALAMPDAPASASAVGQAGRSGVAGAPAADSLAVRVTDQYGNPAPGVRVTFAAENDGSVSPASVETGADGIARAQWTMGPAAGAQQANATAAGLPAVAFAGVTGPALPTRVVLTPDSLSFSSFGDSAQLSVRALDPFGNAVGGVPVTLTTWGDAADLRPGAVVRARRRGTTHVIASLPGARPDTTFVSVTQVAVRVVGLPDSLQVRVGQTVQVTAVMVDAGGYALQQIWGSIVHAAPMFAPAFSVANSRVEVRGSPNGNGIIHSVRGRTPGKDTLMASTWQPWGSTGAVDKAVVRVPTVVDDRVHASQVAIGEGSACARVSDADWAMCWGLDSEGQVPGSVVDRCRDGERCSKWPSFVGEPTYRIQFSTIAAGGRTVCGVSREAWCWGSGDFGQLGNGQTLDSNVPVRVSGATWFSTLAVGETHVCGLTFSGEAWCWGLGTSGQLGDGNAASSSVPVQVTGGLRFRAIAAGRAHTCGITEAAAIYCWGANEAGQLGDGSTAQRNQPGPVAGGRTFVSISAGKAATCALTQGGAGYCWGANEHGALGTGSDEPMSAVPAPVAGGHTFRSISSAGTRACGVTTGDVAYCWGALEFSGAGEVSASTATPRALPAWGLTGEIYVGSTQTCRRDTAGLLRCWGLNHHGQLGNGTTANSDTPVYVRIRH